MRHDLAFLRSLGVRATYTPPAGDPVAARAILSDADALIRSGIGSRRLIAHEAEATVAASLGAVRGGRLAFAGAVYVIDELLKSEVSGLVDLGLSRVSGDGVVAFGGRISRAVMSAMRETITVNGAPISAQVSQRGVLREAPGGQPIETVATIAAIAESDAVGVAIYDEATVSGEVLVVMQILRAGDGLMHLVLE